MEDLVEAARHSYGEVSNREDYVGEQVEEGQRRKRPEQK